MVLERKETEKYPTISMLFAVYNVKGHYVGAKYQGEHIKILSSKIQMDFERSSLIPSGYVWKKCESWEH